MSFVIDKTITDKPPKKRSFRSLLGTIVIQHAISVQSLEPRIEKTGSPETFYFLFPLRLSLLAFWNLNTVHSLDSGDKIYDRPRRFLWLFIF